MPKMPRIGGSHTFEELEAIALKRAEEEKAAGSTPDEAPPASKEKTASKKANSRMSGEEG